MMPAQDGVAFKSKGFQKGHRGGIEGPRLGINLIQIQLPEKIGYEQNQALAGKALTLRFGGDDIAQLGGTVQQVEVEESQLADKLMGFFTDHNEVAAIGRLFLGSLAGGHLFRSCQSDGAAGLRGGAAFQKPGISN